MRRGIVVLLVVLGGALLTPSSGGAHGDASTVNGAGQVYVLDNATSLEVWQESNGDSGLQISPHCHPSGAAAPCVGETQVEADTLQAYVEKCVYYCY